MQPEQHKLRDIKTAICSYISEALVLLKRDALPDETAVHDVRVLMKKSRAAIKLLSTWLDGEVFRREYLTYRDTGRSLCKFRETSVHRKTLKAMKKQHRELFTRLESNEKIALLMQGDLHTEITSEAMTSLENTIKILSKAGFRMRFLSLGRPELPELLVELEKSYNVVCSDYLECRNNPKSARLHQLRKRLKDLLYQLWFFRPMNNSAIKALERKIDSLAQYLGVNNDLTQLLEVVEYKLNDAHESPEMDELMILIRNKQDQLLAKVWPVAYKLFCPGRQLTDLMGIEVPGNTGQPLPDPIGSGENNL